MTTPTLPEKLYLAGCKFTGKRPIRWEFVSDEVKRFWIAMASVATRHHNKQRRT